VRATPLPTSSGVSLGETFPVAVEVPIALERRGDATLFGLVPEVPEKRPRRFERFTVMSDAGRVRWGASVTAGTAALSPSGTRVAMLVGQRVAPEAKGAVQTKAGWEEVVLFCDRLDGLEPTIVAHPLRDAPVPPVRGVLEDQASWKYRSAVRAVAFLDEMRIAVLVGVEPTARYEHRERVLLLVFDMTNAHWQVLHDEHDAPLDTFTLFRTADGLLVAHGRDMPQHTSAPVRVFEPKAGGIRLRQAYEQPGSERTESQRVDPGSWFVVHPTSGFVVQRFHASPTNTLELQRAELVHVDARTAAETLLGPIALNERPVLTSSGEVMAYETPEWASSPKGKRAKVGLHALLKTSGDIELPRPHAVDHLAPGLLAVGVKGEAIVVDVERREVISTREVASPVVDDLSASADGRVTVARQGAMALVRVGTTGKVQSLGSGKHPRLFATGADLTVGVAGRALEIRRGATTVAATKGEGILMGGLLAHPGAIVVDASWLTLFRLEGDRLVAGAKREVGGVITCVDASPDGSVLAVGGEDGRVHVFAGDGLAPLGTTRISERAVTQVALHADGVRALSLCEGAVRADDLSSGSSSPLVHPKGRAWAGIACHRSEPWAALVDDLGVVYLAHTETGELSTVGRHHEGARRLVLLDGMLLVGGGLHSPPAGPPASVVRYALGRSA
jgi:hypothetical protein